MRRTGRSDLCHATTPPSTFLPPILYITLKGTLNTGGEATMPPRKRQRTQKQPIKRKPGLLSDFLNLPTEIFNEIASCLLPLDLLHFARSNRLFCGLLMNKSARGIWLSSIKNFEGLPPCPPTMNEPQYVALLFTSACSMCGSDTRNQMDEHLLVRPCKPCSTERARFMTASRLPQKIFELVHSTRIDVGHPSAWVYEPRDDSLVVRDEAYVIVDKYNEFTGFCQENTLFVIQSFD
ncbi:unnamed protein product [Rhizoctonia solani]|nr:unnamed protein product [Rhizoctonia solani]